MAKKHTIPPIIYGKTRAFRLEETADNMLVAIAKEKGISASKYIREVLMDSLLYHKEHKPRKEK